MKLEKVCVAVVMPGARWGEARDKIFPENAFNPTWQPHLPGVGPALAKRFTNKGIATYEDLYAVWVEREGDSKKMTGWMLKSMPGINRLTLARAVKGMASEFAARG